MHDRSEGLPMMGYFKKLLSAPSVYIGAFKSIMSAYRAKIDAVSGGKYDNQAHIGDEWHGPLTRMYMHAPPTLRTFMTRHQTTEGLDLCDADPTVARAILVAAIQNERRRRQAANPEQIDDETYAWTRYIDLYTSHHPELFVQE
jgi:hypothetical protein